MFGSLNRSSSRVDVISFGLVFIRLFRVCFRGRLLDLGINWSFLRLIFLFTLHLLDLLNISILLAVIHVVSRGSLWQGRRGLFVALLRFSDIGHLYLTPILLFLVVPTCNHSIISPSLLGILLCWILFAFFAAFASAAQETLAEENEDEQAHHDPRHNDHDQVNLLKVPDVVTNLFVEANLA